MGVGDTLCVCVTNRIPVAEGFEDEFEERFSQRVHLVNSAPGFIRNEVHRPRPMKFCHSTGKWEKTESAQGFYEVKTWWRSLSDFEAWTRSELFAEAHNDQPSKDMFSGSTRIEITEVLLSTDVPHSFMSLAQLSSYRGEAGRPIYIGVKGKVYDVSSSAGFYGPGGGYHVLSGRDASRALAKNFLDEKKVLDRPGDLSNLTGAEQLMLDDWISRFNSKYPIIARLETNRDVHKEEEEEDDDMDVYKPPSPNAKPVGRTFKKVVHVDRRTGYVQKPRLGPLDLPAQKENMKSKL